MDKNRPYITIIEGESKGEQIDIDSDSFLIGRHSDCQYVITLREISRYHAHIFFKEGHWWIEDKESLHGTFIHKMQRVSKTQPIRLEDGMHIYLANKIHILFTDPTSTLPDVADQILMDGLWINQETGDIFIRGKKLKHSLAPNRALVLRKLYNLDGALWSRDEMITTLWPDAGADSVSNDTVDAFISRLNQQLRKYDPDHDYIKTIRGQGWVFSQRVSI